MYLPSVPTVHMGVGIRDWLAVSSRCCTSSRSVLPARLEMLPYLVYDANMDGCHAVVGLSCYDGRTS